MKAAATPSRWRWRVVLLAALTGVLALLLPAAPASAATSSAAESRVGALHPAAAVVVGVHECISAGQCPVRGPSQLQVASGSRVAAEAGTGASKPFVMGIKDHLDDFATTHGGQTWKSLPESQLPGDAWKSGVTRKLADPDQRVLFNLDGVDVWGGVTRAASGKGGATDWELLQIRSGGFPNLEFWQGGTRVGNPFG